MNLDHFDTILAFAAVMAGVSLIITALTQAVSGVFGLRGHNLKWGLEKLIGTLAPGLEAKTEVLARQILLHPLLSDSSFGGLKKLWTWWRYASHIRQDDLRDLLAKWRTALSMPRTNDQEKAARATALNALNAESSLRETAKELCLACLKTVDTSQITAGNVHLPSAFQEVLTMPNSTDEEKAKRAKALYKLTEQASFLTDVANVVKCCVTDPSGGSVSPGMLWTLPTALKDALALPQTTEQEKTTRNNRLAALDFETSFWEEAASRLTSHLKTIEDGLKDWFDASMDRVSQRFTANMRAITVAGAVIVSLVFVVDSNDLWKQMARNPGVRNKVIASSDALLKKADEMQVGSTNLPAGIYRVAAVQLLSLHTNELARFSGTEIITNQSSGTNWLVTQCRTHGMTNATRWLEEYQALVPQAALRQAADNMHSLLEEQLALGMISSRRPNESWSAAVWAHFGGILVSIVLLSLGAPFWFNLLRSLSNLRPVLATKDTREQEARLKAVAAGKTTGGKP
jgi:formiminotetrahydrofolate cyclodeaminase